ncbi:MAG: O-methyltransferase [Thermoguttaceae bacterium]|nr:O-methyltransferase [Thermoguttaceae bacterium]MDW8077941.1 O-methyltransferase [Thermoguttaceae bacterium]
MLTSLLQYGDGLVHRLRNWSKALFGKGTLLGIVTVGLFGAVIVGIVWAEEQAQEDPVAPIIKEVDKRCRDERIPMVGPERAVRLAELVRQQKPKLVVECGTAIGYSALWIGRELKKLGQGRLITIEIDEERVADAREYIKRAGLDDVVEVRHGDARELVKQITEPVDFLFLDCGYENYYPCLMGIKDRLRPGAIVVADNVGIGERGMRDYLKYVRQHFKSTTEWFDVDLPWAKRDAMEVSIVPEK